jgi:hypothetical protein
LVRLPGGRRRPRFAGPGVAEGSFGPPKSGTRRTEAVPAGEFADHLDRKPRSDAV